jgi:uncharacterized SAM-binding protein YcdF (DUF218 family)
MAPPPLIVIFGAAVLPDGRPSRALMRRIGYGHAAAMAHPDAPVLCSGGVGRPGPSEASAMASVLRARGLVERRLIVDEESRDTLQSVLVAHRLVRAQGHAHVVVCSDRYHVPRIRLMLGALGVATEPGPAPAGAYEPSRGHTLRMALREAVAIPYDLAIVLARRRAFAEAAS